MNQAIMLLLGILAITFGIALMRGANNGSVSTSNSELVCIPISSSSTAVVCNRNPTK